MEKVSINEVYGDNKYLFIDVRSEKEFKEDHIIGAINMPILDDLERDTVGKLYKQVNKDEAIKKGIEYATPKISEFYEKVEKLSKDKKIVFYCFRGGMRSSSIAGVMKTLKKEVYILEGGYKSYRKYVMDYIKTIPENFKAIMLHGNTGVGKTHILEGLDEKGENIIDLEYLAKNRGSAFGNFGYKEETSQKMFESNLVDKFSEFETKYFFVESESRRIGNIILPKSLHKTMLKGIHILIKTNMENRVKVIMRDYIYADIKGLDQKIKSTLEHFRKNLSNKRVDELIECVDKKEYETIIKVLFRKYYDPLYEHSIKKYKYEKVLDYKKIEDAVNDLILYKEENFS